MPHCHVTIYGADGETMADLVRVHHVHVYRQMEAGHDGGYQVSARADDEMIRRLTDAGYRVQRHEDLDEADASLTRAFASGAHKSGGAPAAQTVTLTVDATEAQRKLFRAQQVIPVNPGTLTLYYPKWIPGTHGPTGPIINLSGLKFTASGKTLPWRRDPVDMYTFHLDVPQGATTVQASFEFLAPTSAGSLSSDSSTTSHLFIFWWNWMLLYPPVAHTDDLMFEASVRLPPG
jgi:Peptidase M61 N-terminal domain